MLWPACRGLSRKRNVNVLREREEEEEEEERGGTEREADEGCGEAATVCGEPVGDAGAVFFVFLFFFVREIYV